jgi:hypothetical protein
MSRIINIYIDIEPDQNQELNNIHIDNISVVPNYSINKILLQDAQKIEENKVNKLLTEIMTKLTMGGEIIISFIDFNSLCYDYLNKILTDKETMKYIHTIKNILSFKIIESTLDNRLFRIAKIDKNKYNSIITIERIQL